MSASSTRATMASLAEEKSRWLVVVVEVALPGAPKPLMADLLTAAGRVRAEGPS